MTTPTATRFRKKPVEIEAMQLPVKSTPAEAIAVYQWVESHIGSVPAPGYEETQSDHEGVTIDPADGLMTIRTLEGDMKVSLGDWVIRGVQGEFYPCKPDIFEATYAAVENAPVNLEESAEDAARRFATELNVLRIQLAAGDASDGYHTHNELYDYRMLYNAHAALGWLAAGYRVVKSWKHSDGELCFGGGWFVVAAEIPTGDTTEQITNHYEGKHWALFQVPEELPPAYDGHTPPEAAERLRASLSTRDQSVLGEIAAERARQDAKWGEQNHPDGTGRTGYVEKAALARSVCQMDAEVTEHGPRWSLVLLEEVYEALAEENPAKLRAELVQVAAVAVAWIEAIDRRALGLDQDRSGEEQANECPHFRTDEVEATSFEDLSRGVRTFVKVCRDCAYASAEYEKPSEARDRGESHG